MTLQWREEMAIDHGVIDRDHQSLIAIINEFSAAQTDAAGALPAMTNILGKLEHYATIHFGREEALQREAQYAYLEAHHHEHGDLIKQLAAIRVELVALNAAAAAASESCAPGPAPTHALGRMAEFLNHWLVDHIIRSDLRMKPYAAKMASHARRLKPLMQTIAWVDG